MDFIIRAGSLASELITRNIQNFQPLVMIILIHLLYRCVLRCEAAACRRVDDHDDLPFIICKIQGFAFAGSDGVILDHDYSSCFYNDDFIICLMEYRLIYYTFIPAFCQHRVSTAFEAG